MVIDELMKSSVTIPNYFYAWANRLKMELDDAAGEPLPQSVWLYHLLSFGTSNHVVQGIGEGRFSPRFKMGQQCFPTPSLFPSESYHWFRKLAAETANIALKARLLDFCWEHSSDRNYHDAVGALDAYREMARLFAKDRKAWPTTVDALDRSLDLACRLNDRQRAEECRDEMLAHLRRCRGEERLAELWDCASCVMVLRAGRLRDLLLPEVLVELASIIDDIAEAHRTINEFHGERHFLNLLADIRRALGDPDAEQQIASRQARSFQTHAVKEAAKENWFVAAGFFADAVAAFQRAGDAEMADRMKLRTREANAAGVERMEPAAVTVQIPRASADAYIDQFAGAPDVATALWRLSVDPHWLLDPEEAAQMADDVQQSAPFYSMVSKGVLRGDRVAVTASDDDENRRHLEMQAHSEKLQVILHLRHEAMVRLCQQRGLCPGDMVAHLQGWPFMPRSKMPFFRRAVDAYFAKDYVIALHVMTPHLEDLLRLVARAAGFAATGFHTDGSQTEQVLGDVLRHPKVQDLLGVPLQQTLLFVLTEEQGFNLRNAVAHGFLSEEQCDVGAVELMFWVLLALTILRPTRSTPPAETDVAVAAHRRWQARGGTHGRDLEDWFAATRDLSLG